MPETTFSDAGDVLIPDLTGAAREPHSVVDQGTPRAPRDKWTVTAIALAALAVAACVAVLISTLVPTRGVVAGIQDSGQFTELTLSAMKALFDLSAALTVGWLLAAVALAPPQKSGLLDVGGYRAMRAASLSASVWMAASIAMAALTTADIAGRPLQQALNADLMIFSIQNYTAVRGYLICAFLAV